MILSTTKGQTKVESRIDSLLEIIAQIDAALASANKETDKDYWLLIDAKKSVMGAAAHLVNLEIGVEQRRAAGLED